MTENSSAVDALHRSPGEWHAAGADAAALAMLRPLDTIRASDLAWLDAPDHHLIGWDDPDYPALLRRISSPPPALFVAGDPNLLWHAQIAVVGSRNATAGGVDNARDFARALVASGLTITSGMAEGVDAAAHLAALEAHAPTIAVVGTGTDIIYPRRHARLAARIRANGAIVSEFLPGTEAQAQHFPRRNRVIAGLTLGTLVIEAAERSGALITARLAGDAGREVFAVPGSIHNPLARGCHKLIRQGAALVENAREVIEALAPVASELADALRARLREADVADTPKITPGTTAPAAALDASQLKLMAALGHDPVGIDQLAGRTGLTVAELSSMLLVMELHGLITAEHGRYARRASIGV
ncbi:MAG TPA: DNA-processing protein DprA [Xanthomonadaceae bacterium]|jgi:DNA processing protein|nr:DNA-processing protein DprA [Xanthomonadaceae bacterium]